jgi:uncharacterized phage protein gp47/JayE
MAIKNTWVGYVDRSYQQIKDSLLGRLTINNPEITDHSESNILVVIVSMFAGVAEMFGYYIDNMARESFIATARRFTSIVKLVKLLDYRIKAAYPSTADLTFTFSPATTGPGVIPVGTMVKTGNNVPFVTIQNLSVPSGVTSATMGAKQIVRQTSVNLGTTTGAINQAFVLGSSYVDGTSLINIDGTIWTPVSSLGLSTPTDKHYIIEIDVDGLAYVVFGNGTNGEIPPTPFAVMADYDITTATLGNVEANSITTLVSSIILPGVSSVTVTNPNPSTGGSPYEDLERIRINAPLSIRTLDRAVTDQDYRDITRMAPGVGRSEVYFNCGKKVKIYIIPTLGGIASTPLLTSVFGFVTNRKMITTFIDVMAAGQTNLILNLEVTCKFREDPILVSSETKAALVKFGSYDNQNINKKIRVSDIIALVDNLPKVEFVDLVGLGTRPYARPINHMNQLLWVRQSLVGSTTKSLWRITFAGGTLFNVVKNNTFMGTATTSMPFIDPDSSLLFTIVSSSYISGQSWTFTSYPWNKNIEVDDFTMPFIDINDITLTINEQLIPPIE